MTEPTDETTQPLTNINPSNSINDTPETSTSTDTAEPSTTNDSTEPVINIWDDTLGNIGSIARCGAHCLQLASVKVTKMYDRFINPLRNFIKQSRLANNRHIFANICRPSEDNITRWSSTFKMVKEFQQNKETYKLIQHPSFSLSEEIWQFIEEYHQCFYSVDQSMLYFQSEKHTMCKYCSLFIYIYHSLCIL